MIGETAPSRLARPPDAREGRDGEYVIATRGLTKRYGSGRAAVDSLDLRVRRGEVYGFLSPNGAGKTTTLRMLLGLIRPSAGTATVLGRTPGDPAGLAGVGALVEGPAFYPYLSGRENLRVLADYAGIPFSRVESALEKVALVGRAGDKFRAYSLGMKQRLGVGAALTKEPEIVILDEPTNGLDPEGIAEMRVLIRSIAGEGRTVILSSHLLGEVESVCDRAGLMQNGKLIAEGTVGELRGSPGLLVRAEPLGRAEELVRAMPGVARVEGADGSLRIESDPECAGDINAGLVSSGVRVTELRPVRRSLEDVFFELTSDEGGGAMVGSFKAELRKLRRRSGMWVLGAICLFLILFFGYGLPYLLRDNPSSANPEIRSTGELVATLLPEKFLATAVGGVAGFGGALALILAAMVAGGEYGWGTLKTVLTRKPARLRVFSGQAAALALAALLFALLILVPSALASLAVAGAEGRRIAWPPSGEIARALGASWLILGAWAALGLALATLFRQTALAIGLGLVYLLVLEGLIGSFAGSSGLIADIRQVLPAANAQALAGAFGGSGGPPGAAAGPPIGAARAALVLSAYAAGLTLLAGFFYQRRDVT